MRTIDKIFLCLLAAWLLTRGGGGVLAPEPPIGGGGEKVLLIADPDDREAAVVLSAKWRSLLSSDDLVVADTTDRPDEENFALAWDAHRAAAPVAVIAGPRGGEVVPLEGMTADRMRELCLKWGIE